MSELCQNQKSGLLGMGRALDRITDYETRGSLIRNDAPP